MANIRKTLPFVVLLVAVVAVVATIRRWTDASAGSAAVGRAAECYYDGDARRDCPTPRTGPAADTAWLWAAAVDTLYTRADGAVGPATLIALVARLAELPPAGPADTLARALTAAAPALAPDTAAAPRAARCAAAPPGALATPVWTIGAKQRAYDAETAARAVAGRARGRDEALPPRGLLALSRPAVVGRWAALYAERTIVPEAAGAPAVVERRVVLASRLPDGRWRAVRIVSI
ncbi:hypothetical protein [Roseisolibacter sp. H3M3-2]|uniref:hypothetical protein n=1 Tax=Roseisolibacter sp. H3M3-2 TaxID=3031323 RepID=UPI0023DA572E|nr:hypothetical protein [Roseisolibacter sp. H3M3-2]MDF1502211.1 hypothetical protein [Roseisolibacter sp. H3M3-2]